MSGVNITNRLLKRYIKNFNVYYKTITTKTTNKSSSSPIMCMCVLGGSAVLYTAYNQLSLPRIYAANTETNIKPVKLTARERRFIRFASVEYHNQLYMTPQDFLESVVEAEPRPRMRRKILNKKEIKIIKRDTPTLERGSTCLFRSLKHKGIISYTEYLFLLSILTNPPSGFQIAFNMFDADENKRMDKNEFLVLEKIFSHTWKDRRGILQKNSASIPLQEYYVDDEQGLQRKHIVDTTLIVHFFGQEGSSDLNFESFKRFMLHLQTELLEMEFNEFSKGLPTISEVEFAKILLRYTYMDIDEYDLYLDHVLDRIKDNKGITFEEFQGFCYFLNFLEDFHITLQLYLLADHPIAKDEFHRGVKVCTGILLTPHVVDTIFAIFGYDNGLLDCRRFIGIMEDRQNRGFKKYAKNEGWEAFKSCVKLEMFSPA